MPPSKAAPKKTDAPLNGRRSRDREVIEAAVKLFWEKGYASTSVQDVADELGMMKGSLYYYIDGKDDLLRKIFEDSHREVQEIAERHRAADGKAVDRLRAFFEEYALWCLTHLQRASLYAREWRHASEDLRALMAVQRRYYDELLVPMIKSAIAEGSVSADLDIRMANYFIMSAITSIPDWFDPAGKLSADAVAKRYADLAMLVITRSAS
ncbi:TetR/AcrR family transcriptional regulator [Dactylosporangium salmoneum]